MKPGLGVRHCPHCNAKVAGAGSKLLRDCPSCGANLDGHSFSRPAKPSSSLIPWVVVVLLCVMIGIGIAVFFEVRALQGTTPSATAAATVDAGPSPGSHLLNFKPFDRAAASQQLSDAAETIDDCREPGSPASGTVVVTVVIQPNGKVSEVSFARSGFNETTEGKCIIERFSKVRVPPFAGPIEKLSKSVTLP